MNVAVGAALVVGLMLATCDLDAPPKTQTEPPKTLVCVHLIGEVVFVAEGARPPLGYTRALEVVGSGTYYTKR